MPVVPGSLSQTSYSPYYEWGHPKGEPGLGATKVEEGDETESNHFSFGAEHTEDPNRFVSLKPYQQRYPPIEMSIQNYTDAGDDGTRPFPKGRQMALHGSMGELFAYQDKDGNYRVYDGASLSQGEGATAAKQVGAWDGEPLFDAYDTDFGNSPAPGWGRPDETPKRMSRRMELLEVMATALSQAHPNAKLFPYRGDTPVAPNPELFKKSWDLMKMPAEDRRYTLTEEDIKRIAQLSSEGMSQAAIHRLFVEEGILYPDTGSRATGDYRTSRGMVHYWANQASRMKQREKNALRTYEPGSEENARRIERDQEKRRENWDADPEMKERHELQSTKDETRSERHTFRGKPVEEAMKRLESGELSRRNSKINEDELP